MTTHVVLTSDARAARNLNFVVTNLGVTTESLDLDAVPLDRSSTEEQQEFKDTPQPLLESWVAHRKLMSATTSGDTVIVSDWRGLGGLFALYQWSLPAVERRTVVTVAADSAYLHWHWVARSVDQLPMPLASQVDWEIVQYRSSTRVIALSSLAVALLSKVEAVGELLAPEPEPSSLPSGHRTIWAPGPVSRRNRTGDLLRAATGIESDIIVSDRDEDDEVWTGTSWDALRHSRAVLGARLSRASTPETPPSVVVLGDPFSVPEDDVVSLVTGGVPVVVPVGSAAAARWPTAPGWTDSDDLVTALSGSTPTTSILAAKPISRRSPSLQRARRVSVGIPVFRDVRFLDECLESVLGQDLDPAEILIVDDGSGSDEIDSALNEARSIDQRIRVLNCSHRGVCVARNRALQEMTGDAFLFIDSDDVLEPGFLERCAEGLRSDGRIWAMATWTRFVGTYRGVEAKPPFDRRVGLRENPIISTAALVDMRVRESGVHFEPDLAFLYCEDWHFWSQVLAAGGKFGLVPEPLIRHRVHENSGGFMRTDLALALGMARATEPIRQ